jgi:hypothetical protein
LDAPLDAQIDYIDGRIIWNNGGRDSIAALLANGGCVLGRDIADRNGTVVGLDVRRVRPASADCGVCRR